MKRVIVTGANGFIGSAVVRELVKHQVKVLALDRYGCDGNIIVNDLVTFYPMQLEEMGQLPEKIEKNQYDTFYHFAWNGSAGKMRSDVKVQLENIRWTIDCLRVAKKIGCKRFVGAGSIMEEESIALTKEQERAPSPSSIYSTAKYSAHAMAKAVAAEEKMEFVWPMISNAYGPGEKSERFINTLIRSCISKNPITLTSGEQQYDFVYITDVARAFYYAGEYGKSFTHYMIGSGRVKQLKDFVRKIGESIDPDLKLCFGTVPFSGVNLPRESFDCTRLYEDTGFTPVVPFEEGIEKTIQWVKEQMESEHERGK